MDRSDHFNLEIELEQVKFVDYLRQLLAEENHDQLLEEVRLKHDAKNRPIKDVLLLTGISLVAKKLIGAALEVLVLELDLFPQNGAARKLLADLLAAYRQGPSHIFEIECVLPFLNTNSLVIDVGANVGSISDLFLQRGFPVLAVEPCARISKFLNSRFKESIDNFKMEIQNFAASNEAGKHKLYYDDYSLATYSTVNEQWLKFYPNNFRQEVVEEVEGRSVSSMLELSKFSSLEWGFLKIDCPGHEWQVLSGALKKKNMRPRALMFECISSPNSKQEIQQTMTLLFELGYRNFRLVTNFGSIVIKDSEWLSREALIHNDLSLWFGVSGPSPLETTSLSLLALAETLPGN